MTKSYENVFEEFNKRNCKLLVSEEEFNQLKKGCKQLKLNYIASCGHNHNVFYNVFKSRNTGVICPSCKNKEIGKNMKVKIQNNEISKNRNIEQEFTFIKEFQIVVGSDFEIIKAFDGCNVDIIYKPINIVENKWVGIQVKTTNKMHLTYSFGFQTDYKNCLILLFCVQDKSMWLIPENIISNQKKVSIGYNNSKYNIYKVNNDNIIDKLDELYTSTSKFEFDILNKPTNIYQHREQEFKKFRQETIQFINFHYDEMEGTVYDFKINNFKVQEKVAKLCKENRYIFFLCKNNGKLNSKQNIVQYDIGDNDFYWLNCENKQIFFVIPEQKLIEKGLIGNKEENNNRKTLKITIKDELHNKSQWLTHFMFNYETINEEDNKLRLCNLLK
jgi:hypothetical protein